MKRIIYIVLLSILSFSIISCKNNEESTTSTQHMEYYPDGYLDVVDSKYFLECENKGTLIKSSYPSYDYLNDVEKTNKKDRDFKIYLPYGYDENDLDTKYDILYLMHGWFGSINSFFNSYPLTNMLDNMINEKLIKPLIVVALTYNIDNDTDALYQGIEEVKVFHNDLIENAIPFIETKYHTYLDSNSDDGIKSSRLHRGFGGYSLGGVATWSTLVERHDYVSKFLPMSGVLLNVGSMVLPKVNINASYFIEEEKKFHNQDYQIYAATGTEDILYVSMTEFLKRIKPTVNDKLSYYVKEGATHNDIHTKEYLFNGLINLFGVENE